MQVPGKILRGENTVMINMSLLPKDKLNRHVLKLHFKIYKKCMFLCENFDDLDFGKKNKDYYTTSNYWTNIVIQIWAYIDEMVQLTILLMKHLKSCVLL